MMAVQERKEKAIENFDDILDHVGGWNRYQAILLVIRYFGIGRSKVTCCEGCPGYCPYPRMYILGQ